MLKFVKFALLAACLLAAGAAQAQNTSNLSVSIFTPFARTATVISPDQTNVAWKGGTIVVNVGLFTAGTITPTIQGKDAVSGAYYTMLTGVAISGAGVTTMTVYPGITAAANIAVNTLLPRVWRIVLVGASANMNISVGASLAP